MKIKISIITLILCWQFALNAGRYAGDFIVIGPGVRALGMGGAFSAVANDGSAIYWNAAGISQLKVSEVQVMRAYLYQNLAYYDNISYCQPLPNNVTIGVNWTRLTIDDIPRFSEEHLAYNVDMRSIFPDLHLTGNPDGYFKSADDLFQFAFSKHVHYDLNFGWLFFELPLDFHFGGEIKYIKRKIDNFLGKGTGFDFGLLAKTDLSVLLDLDWAGTLSFGANFQDIGGTVITWDTESNNEDEILFNTKIGFAIHQPIPRFKSYLIMAIDKDYIYGGTTHYGMEISYKEMVGFRLGAYNKNVSAGMSIKLYEINIDYAFVTNVLGNTNRIGLRIKL
jgi:hypothetical protein